MLKIEALQLRATSDDSKIAQQAKSDMVLAKMEVATLVRNVMPAGVPKFTAIRHLPPISQLTEAYGEATMLKVLVMMVKDFCSGINAVRNMNEGQMIDAACMLLDECSDFRLEDYMMMFTLAKRGQLVKILDRVDTQLIGQLMDEYWKIRNEAGKKLQGNADEFELLDSPALKTLKDTVDKGDISESLTNWKKELEEEKSTPEELKRDEQLRQQRKDWIESQGDNLNWEEFQKQFGKKAS